MDRPSWVNLAEISVGNALLPQPGRLLGIIAISSAAGTPRSCGVALGPRPPRGLQPRALLANSPTRRSRLRDTQRVAWPQASIPAAADARHSRVDLAVSSAGTALPLRRNRHWDIKANSQRHAFGALGTSASTQPSRPPWHRMLPRPAQTTRQQRLQQLQRPYATTARLTRL